MRGEDEISVAVALRCTSQRATPTAHPALPCPARPRPHLLQRGPLLGQAVLGGGQQGQGEGAAAGVAQLKQEVVQLLERQAPLHLHLRGEGKGREADRQANGWVRAHSCELIAQLESTCAQQGSSACSKHTACAAHLAIAQKGRHVARARQRVGRQQEGAHTGHQELALPHSCRHSKWRSKWRSKRSRNQLNAKVREGAGAGLIGVEAMGRHKKGEDG